MSDLVGEPAHFPRMPGQQADIMPGSPLAVVALFTEIIRQRFRPGNGLAWEWSDDPNPQPTEAETVAAPRRVVIEPTFTKQAETRDYEPAIYVGKGSTVPSKVALNNKAGQQLRSGYKGFYTLAQMPIKIEVVASEPGASATIADVAWFFLLSGREEIRKTFGLHDMENPVLSETTPSARAKDMWSTFVTTTVLIEFRWTTVPISPLLREIVVKYHQSGDPADVYLLKQYIR